LNSLKKEFLELLDKDLEFRYAIAGYLGISEILKRLDNIAEEQVKLREEQIELRKEQIKIREEQNKLREEQLKLREEQIKLGKEQIRIAEEQVKLREDFNKMLLMFEKMENRLIRVERTLEKLTIDIKDEAKSVIKFKLKELGISLKLTSLVLPDLEINVYGTSDDICVIGKATVRAGAKLIDELLEKFEKLRNDYPNFLRKKIIFVIYASLPMAELIEKAKEKNIWLLKATEEFFRPEKIFYEI
jgi:hypothetical protein